MRRPGDSSPTCMFHVLRRTFHLSALNVNADGSLHRPRLSSVRRVGIERQAAIIPSVPRSRYP
jgi:hypothetical protein